MATLDEIHTVLRNHEDLYGILSIDRNATEGQIKRGYRLRALKFHPDKNPGSPKATEAFKMLTRANEVLMDDDKRHIYDNQGYDGLRRFEEGGGQPSFAQVAMGFLYSYARRWETFGPVREYENAEDSNTEAGRDRVENALRSEMKLMAIFVLLAFTTGLLGLLLGSLGDPSASNNTRSGAHHASGGFFAHTPNNGGFVSFGPHPDCPHRHAAKADIAGPSSNRTTMMIFYSNLRSLDAALTSADEVNLRKHWVSKMKAACSPQISLAKASMRRSKKETFSFTVDAGYKRPAEKTKFRDDATVKSKADRYHMNDACRRFGMRSGMV